MYVKPGNGCFQPWSLLKVSRITRPPFVLEIRTCLLKERSGCINCTLHWMWCEFPFVRSFVRSFFGSILRHSEINKKHIRYLIEEEMHSSLFKRQRREECARNKTSHSSLPSSPSLSPLFILLSLCHGRTRDHLAFNSAKGPQKDRQEVSN